MPGTRSFVMVLAGFLVVLAASFLGLLTSYHDPTDGTGLDRGQALYAVFTLLQFETPLPLPNDWETRLIFFFVPVAGILVLGQGVIGLGRALFDKETWSRAMAETSKDHVIICGLGKVSIAVLEWLRALNEQVVVIEVSANNILIEQARSLGGD
jgi:voltage-gated potassium channel